MFSNQYRIDEKCSCGAEFHYVGISPFAQAVEWRRGHRHSTTPQPAPSGAASESEVSA